MSVCAMVTMGARAGGWGWGQTWHVNTQFDRAGIEYNAYGVVDQI